jgi:hypothetical protein
MPELGSQVLEVVLGLAFIYLVFSLVCSALQEWVSTLFAWRSENLEAGLRSMLCGQSTTTGAEELFNLLADNPRIKAMMSPKRRFRKRQRIPSYLAPRTFSLVLLDTLAPPEDGAASKNLVEKARKGVQGLSGLPDDVKRQLLGLLDVAGDSLDDFRTELENWFNDTMNRVSGWYRRKAQLWLVFFGLAVAAVGNVDTFHLVDRLWNDPGQRAAIVAQAEGAAAAGNTEQLQAQIDEDLGALELPVGWTLEGSGPQDFPDSIDLVKVLGIIVSGLALALGAPFWFDALSKISRLRATGKPEGRAPGTANP